MRNDTEGPLSAVLESLREARADEAKANVELAYWHRLIPDFTYSPQQFYVLLGQALEARRVPDLEVQLVTLHEGHALSARRLYFRAERERLCFDICAAPFGTGFFVSSRMFDRRRPARLWHWLAAGTILAVLGGVALWQVGLLWGVVAVTGAFTLAWSLLRAAAADPVGALARSVSRSPLLGPIYDTLFRPDTYFRRDLHTMYRATMQQALDEVVGQVSRPQGERLEPAAVGAAEVAARP
jgi:hypothetical protein